MQQKILKGDFDKQKTYIDLVKKINEDKKKLTGKAPVACVKTFGCQQNVADSEKIKGIASSMGYVINENIENADFVIYNTCAVRENAEDRVFGNTGMLKKLKKNNPNMIIGLCGCMMQQPHIVKIIKQSYPQVDLIMGTHSLHLLPQLLYKILDDKVKVIDIEDRDGIFPEGLPILRDEKDHAWVPIMYGCDNFCTYCIVPYVRGRERSRKSIDVINEVKTLVNNGYKKITLLGQNVNSYGKGLEEKINFNTLLREINEISGEFEISFMTSHPKDCSKELIDTISECDKISKHLHLPVQSGSNRILTLMNRKYTIDEYKKLINYAKEKISGLILSTDIIVGFPGETYEDFVKTKEIVEYVKYDFLYTFIYSRRVGTVAADMDDFISSEEKHKWFNELLNLQEDIKSKKI